MSLKWKPEFSNIKRKKDIISVHDQGVMIAKRHLTPFLKNLEKERGFTQIEIASALILVSYSAVFGAVKNRMQALTLYRDLSRLSISYLKKSENDKTLH